MQVVIDLVHPDLDGPPTRTCPTPGGASAASAARSETERSEAERSERSERSEASCQRDAGDVIMTPTVSERKQTCGGRRRFRS